MPFTPEEAAELAARIGEARGLRPGQLPPGAQFAEALNGHEQCAAFIAAVGDQTRTPFPAVEFVPVATVEPSGGGRP